MIAHRCLYELIQEVSELDMLILECSQTARLESNGCRRIREETSAEMKTPYMRNLFLKVIRTLIDWDVGKAKRNFLLEIREAFPLMLVPVMN